MHYCTSVAEVNTEELQLTCSDHSPQFSFHYKYVTIYLSSPSILKSPPDLAWTESSKSWSLDTFTEVMMMLYGGTEACHKILILD